VKMRDWLVAEAKKHTDKVETQEFRHRWSRTGESVTMWNVVGRMDFGAQKTVLLLAHWDTRPYADQDPSPQNRSKPILGANDGASGVALLLELTRVFKEKKPPVNVVFLFTDGEDLGPGLDEMFLGAEHFARNLSEEDRKISYGILLDMVGDRDLVIPREQNSDYYVRTLMDRFYGHAREIGLSKHFPNRPGPVIADDHEPLNRAGIPTIDLIDFDYGPGHSWWHTVEDTPDKCSAASLSAVGRAVESFLRAES
ncbi:MAG: hypothetical protein C4340_04135, partial [Armatimonadota bacterium]